MQRDPSHQPTTDEGELGTAGIGPRFAQLPLLPYERSLIASLDISIEEYEDYLRWAQKQSGVLASKSQITADAVIVPLLISLAWPSAALR